MDNNYRGTGPRQVLDVVIIKHQTIPPSLARLFWYFNCEKIYCEIKTDPRNETSGIPEVSVPPVVIPQLSVIFNFGL